MKNLKLAFTTLHSVPVTDKMRDQNGYGPADNFIIKAMDHMNIATIHGWSPEKYTQLLTTAPIGLKLAIETYVALLQTPGGSEDWRIKNQDLYANLRNYIATATDNSDQEVQEFFEDVALEIKYNGKTFAEAMKIAESRTVNN